MKQIEAVGSSINEAIEEGLKTLGVTLDEVEHEVVGTKGLFHKKYIVRLTVKEGARAAEAAAPVQAKPAPAPQKPAAQVKDEKPYKPAAAPKAPAQERPAEKSERQDKFADPAKASAQEKKFEKKPLGGVRPAPKAPAQKPAEEKGAAGSEPTPRKVAPEQVALAEKYLGRLLELMGMEAKLEIDTSHGSIDVNIVTEDKAIIGHRGEVLDAVQILTKRAVEEGEDKYVHVNIDSHNYRIQREQALVALAERMANKCVRTGKRVVLEPMSNTHRKIIHATLSGDDRVITRSEGRDPVRHVVILPKRN